jgi:hypothetical protein
MDAFYCQLLPKCSLEVPKAPLAVGFAVALNVAAIALLVRAATTAECQRWHAP